VRIQYNAHFLKQLRILRINATFWFYSTDFQHRVVEYSKYPSIIIIHELPGICSVSSVSSGNPRVSGDRGDQGDPLPVTSSEIILRWVSTFGENLQKHGLPSLPGLPNLNPQAVVDVLRSLCVSRLNAEAIPIKKG
jgi:hypothetical protein